MTSAKYINMADTAAKLTKARNLAIAQLCVGFLLFCFGIGEQLEEGLVTSYIYCGIWAGIWVFITGGLGILGTCKASSISRNTFADAFKIFSIISAMLTGGLAAFYSFVILLTNERVWEHRYPKDRNDDGEKTVLAMILILNVIEFVIGIWAVVSIHRMRICCIPPPRRQDMYTANSGYAMTQRPNGVPVTSQMQLSGEPQEGQPQGPYGTMISSYQPLRIDMPPSYEEASSGLPVAVRMQTGTGIVGDQTVISEAQDNEPQIVLLPDSREMNNLPPPYEAVASGYQTLQVDMPPSNEQAEHGQWKTYV